MSTSARLSCPLLFACLLSLCAAAPAVADPPPTDLDHLMAEVLERRDQVWQRFHDYVLDERERVTVTAPGEVPLFGFDREYTWFVQDGYYVRSPLVADGLRLGEQARRRGGAERLCRERRREERARKRAADEAAASGTAGATRPGEGGPHDSGRTSSAPVAAPGETPGTADELTSLFTATAEPRFVSEAYFLKFRFEPGNYFLAGRETFEGRNVLRIEYYPSNLFRQDERADADEARMTRQMNKVALVTLWVDPEARQIVKYVFENVDFGFLPGRWLVRVDEARASMTMGQPVAGEGLPTGIGAQVVMSLASGPFALRYDRRFFDYRRAETSARIRAYTPVER